MTIHTLNDIKGNKKIYNNIREALEKRLEELIKLRDLEERNLIIIKKKILNNKMILKSQIPIEAILVSKKS